MMKDIKEIFGRNNIALDLVSNRDEALSWVMSKVQAGDSVAFAGSETIKQIGVRDYFLAHRNLFHVIDPYESGLDAGEAFERRRQSLLADVLLTGSNAITMDGSIVNMDNQGNRVAGLSFGPRKVLLVVGRNKIVKNLSEARQRICSIAAPLNSRRLKRGNPCEASGRCEGCGLESRICRIFSVIDGQTARDRIKIALVDEDLGF